MYLSRRFIAPCSILLCIQCLMILTIMGQHDLSSDIMLYPSEADSQYLMSNSTIYELIEQSDLVVRGRVQEKVSAWNDDNSYIESDNYIQISYWVTTSTTSAVFGDVISVRTEGGYLDSGVGMKSSNSPFLSQDEEVLLFLYQVDDHFRISGGELGRYVVSGMNAGNPVLRTITSLESLYSEIELALSDGESGSRFPEDWKEHESTTSVYDGYDGNGFVYKNRKWGGTCPEVKFKVNVNSTQVDKGNGSTEDFRNSIVAAANTWNAVASADFVLEYDGPTDAIKTGFNGINEVIFESQGTSMPTGLARFWFTADFTIVEADIWFNDDFDWDATGDPRFTEVDLQSVALHEFGHWLALGHADNPGATMYPTLTMGTLKRELHQDEKDGISFIYPRPADSTCEKPDVATSTPAATPTATPTPAVSATPAKQAAQISTNYSDGAPGSVFVISGVGYVPSERTSFLVNNSVINTIQADSAGEFSVTLLTDGANPGAYKINIPSREARTGQQLSGKSGAPIDWRTAVEYRSQSVSITLDPTKPQRPDESTERSGVPISIVPRSSSLYLPLINS